MSDHELLAYFRRGLIPGPDESEQAFLERIQKSPPLEHPEWKEAALITLPLFHFAVDGISLIYSDQKMALWEGAATWISDDQPPSVQLRSRFKKGSFLGYPLKEVLAHEAVHAARVSFNEPQFEEILAYATAPQAWKRFFGPLFSHSWEALLFIFASIVGIFFPIILFMVIGLSGGWLCFRQWTFSRCRQKLPLAALVCMTDREIRKTAWSNVSFEEKTLRSRLLARFAKR